MGCMCVCNGYLLTCIHTHTHTTTFYTFCPSIQQLFQIQRLVAILDHLCLIQHNLHIGCKRLYKIRESYRNLVGKSLIKWPLGRWGRSLEDNQILGWQLGTMRVWLNNLGPQHTGVTVWTFYYLLSPCGPSSIAGISTGYGLDGPVIESRWRRDFPHLSRMALGPT